LKAFTSCPWARHKAGIAIAIYFAHAALAELGRDAAVRDAFADHLFNRNFRFGFLYRALYTQPPPLVPAFGSFSSRATPMAGVEG